MMILDSGLLFWGLPCGFSGHVWYIQFWVNANDWQKLAPCALVHTDVYTHTHRQPSINYICCSVEDYKKSSQDIWEL